MLILCNFFPLVFPFTANHPDDQASRPLGVGFCDGNHGPWQPLCLQHSHHRRWLDEWPRGANLGRAGYHRNGPQSFSGYFCLYLHICHLRFPTVGEGGERDFGVLCNIPTHSFLSTYGLRRFLKVWTIWKSEPQPDSSFIHQHLHLCSVLKKTLIIDCTCYCYILKIYAHRRRDCVQLWNRMNRFCKLDWTIVLLSVLIMICTASSVILRISEYSHCHFRTNKVALSLLHV